MANDPDQLLGFYPHYKVERLSGTPGKHTECDFFVLDLKHDKFARAALALYAEACEREYPTLSRDLGKMLFRNMP